MTQLPPLIKGCCPEGKRRVLLTVSYDGTAYAGWQRQQNALAVQQVLEEALRKLTGEKTLTVTGSSRTDAGVHALGQRVHFDTASRIPPDKFPFALNTCLPADIRVLEGRYVPAAFHARFDAAGKRYTYRIHNAPHASALYRHLCAHVPVPLQMEPMERSLQTLLGTHDFSAFQAAGGTAKTTVRTIEQVELTRQGFPIQYGAHHCRNRDRRRHGPSAGGQLRAGPPHWRPAEAGHDRPGLRAGADGSVLPR